MKNFRAESILLNNEYLPRLTTFSLNSLYQLHATWVCIHHKWFPYLVGDLEATSIPRSTRHHAWLHRFFLRPFTRRGNSVLQLSWFSTLRPLHPDNLPCSLKKDQCRSIILENLFVICRQPLYHYTGNRLLLWIIFCCLVAIQNADMMIWASHR